MSEKNLTVKDKLKYIFNISTKKTKAGQKEVIPVEPKKGDKGNIKFPEVKFPDKFKELYNYFLNSNIDNSQTLKDRFQRYNDLSFMRYNSNVIWRAIKMYAFETTQADSQDNIITVLAKDKKVVKYINKFLKDINFNKQVMTDIAYNLALYGDAFGIKIIEEKDKKEQITEFIPISVYNVKERIEFNAAKIEEKYIQQKDKQFSTYVKSDKRLQNLVDYISENPKNHGKYFKSYLFGFNISSKITLPPWEVSHFRLYTTESEFFPYGRSLVIGALSAFRQRKSLETLQEMARVFNFPTEIYTVQVDETMTELEKWRAVSEAREEYYNLNMLSQGDKEEDALGKEIWIASDSISYDTKTPNYRLQDIADIELAMEKEVSSTDIPISFIKSDKGNFGISGISLTQQYKPFARSVFIIQNTILEEVSNMIKLQFALSGDFDYETPFELEMIYPVLEESPDKTRAKSDNIRFVNDVLESLKNALGLDRGENLPKEIGLDILKKYSFLDDSDFLRWAEKYPNNFETEKEEKTEVLKEKIKKIKNRLSEELVMETYFEKREESGNYEGVRNQKHFYSSYEKSNKDFNLYLKFIENNRKKKLIEKKKNKINK